MRAKIMYIAYIAKHFCGKILKTNDIRHTLDIQDFPYGKLPVCLGQTHALLTPIFHSHPYSDGNHAILCRMDVECMSNLCHVWLIRKYFMLLIIKFLKE